MNDLLEAIDLPKTCPVIVAGGRDFADYALLERTLDRILKPLEAVEIVSGRAQGADQLGEIYARKHGIRIHQFPADWRRLGNVAGFVRNKQMAEFAAPYGRLIAFPGGRGTAHMVKTAHAFGLPVHIVSPLPTSRDFMRLANKVHTKRGFPPPFPKEL